MGGEQDQHGRRRGDREAREQLVPCREEHTEGQHGAPRTPDAGVDGTGGRHRGRIPDDARRVQGENDRLQDPRRRTEPRKAPVPDDAHVDVKTQTKTKTTATRGIKYTNIYKHINTDVYDKEIKNERSGKRKESPTRKKKNMHAQSQTHPRTHKREQQRTRKP